MLDFSSFLARPEFSNHREIFAKALNRRTDPKRHGDLPRWLASLNALPNVHASHIDLSQDSLKIGEQKDLNAEQLSKLNTCLKNMIPWRKGPFNFFGIHINTEWRSDWKWQRIAPHINSLIGRRILDVGCGTGYHGWRMLGSGADYVMGIDPSVRFAIQFAMAQRYIQSQQFDFLPIGIEDLPKNMNHFDTVFSMGILYHRRNPIEHLRELKSALKPEGELVLETLIVDENFDGLVNGIFKPEKRYAQMRNVWSLASVSHLINLLSELEFKNIQCVDINTTSTDEQRSTEWMKFHSLEQFLDPNNKYKTIEGHPAPKRATIIAQL